MPTYEYACGACGHEWEKEQRISENPVRKCPSCGKRKAERLISGGNFILKGAGWYADLYHKPAASKPASSGESNTSESKSDASKSDASSGDKSTSESSPKKAKKAPAKKSA